MTANFLIKDVVAIESEGRYFDLHNDFGLARVEYDVSSRKLVLFFCKSTGEWINDNDINELHFVHNEVSFFNATYNNPIEHTTDDQTLSFITYAPSDKRLFNEDIYSKDLPDSSDDILYGLENEQFIRVKCNNIELVVSDIN